MNGSRLNEYIPFLSAVGERIFVSNVFFIHDGGNDVIYSTLVVMIDERNDAVLFLGTWEYDENGEWGNTSDGLFVPCILGVGLRIFQEA